MMTSCFAFSYMTYLRPAEIQISLLVHVCYLWGLWYVCPKVDKMYKNLQSFSSKSMNQNDDIMLRSYYLFNMT